MTRSWPVGADSTGISTLHTTFASTSGRYIRQSTIGNPHASPASLARSHRSSHSDRRDTMDTVATSTSQNTSPDFAALKSRQQGAWSSGDYAIVGTTLQIVGEDLCEALDIRAHDYVLDVAAGNGNASLAAARRWCDVVATDYVPALLDRARERAEADRLNIGFLEADAEALPFPSGSFDVVVVHIRGDVHARSGTRRRRDGARLQA